MPRSFSSAIQSDVAWRAALRPLTEPAIWIAPPNSSSFSVSVVLPASGCEMIANVRRRRGFEGNVGHGDGGRVGRPVRESGSGRGRRIIAAAVQRGRAAAPLSRRRSAAARPARRIRNGIDSSRMPRFTCTAKCRCGPVVKPVLPDRPICWPARTRWPTRTSTPLGLAGGAYRAMRAVVVEDADEVGAAAVLLAVQAGLVEVRFDLHHHAVARGQHRRADRRRRSRPRSGSARRCG